MHRLHTRTLLKVMVASTAFLLAQSRASAFYWRGWPGNSVTTERTLIVPSIDKPTVPPSTPFPPPDTSETPYPPIGPPQQTPEPTTGLIGLVGLATFAVGRWVKRKGRSLAA